MAETPSARRRRGRNDFTPEDDPEEVCPYTSTHKRKDYFNGWEESKAEYYPPELELSLEERVEALEEKIEILESKIKMFR